ncbi:MAG: discoidin domain-containing protein [Deltaproteobacteria bacterium]|nr:discoidin domain-containing protein [Deltaproteobacteria bacterium]
MRKTWVLLTVSFILGWSAISVAQELLYARSNSDLKVKKKPGHFSALNLLDGDPRTGWCSAGTGQGAQIEVIFSEKINIDRMLITTGNQSTKNSFKKFSRVREMKVAESDMMHEVELKDITGPQKLNFDPPIDSRSVVFKLKAGFRGTGKRHSCLADIIFYRGKRALNGKKFKVHIRKQKKNLEFIDTWVCGPEYAKNRELIFGVKGIYYFTYVPTDPMEQPVLLKGAWRVKGKQLEIKAKKIWVAIEIRRDDAGVLEQIKVKEVDGVEHGLFGVYTRKSGQQAY